MGSDASDAANPLRVASTNLIEWNVDMRVNVSKARKSKIYQRSRDVLMFVLVIAIVLALSHLRREVRALQVQMQCMNANLLVFVSKYERLNRSLNRGWYQKSSRHYYESKRPIASLHAEVPRASSSSIVELLLNDTRSRVHESSYAYNSVIALPSPMASLRDALLFSNDTRDTRKELRDDPAVDGALTGAEVESADPKGQTRGRAKRAIINFERQNSTAGPADSAADRKSTARDGDTSEIDIPWESRIGRARRDEGRGKKRPQKRRRPKRNRLGPLVATFVGAIPEQHVTDSVYIGPWVKSVRNDSQYSLNKFHLVEEKKSIEVTVNGLYMISAQIFYFGEPTHYSYWILVTSEGKSGTRNLVKCSTATAMSATEVSCFTSVIAPLRRGDRIHIQQQERDRLVNMREGHSFIQLVLLSNGSRKRQT